MNQETFARHAILLAAILLIGYAVSAPADEDSTPALRVDVEGCVAMALRESGRLLSADADVDAREAAIRKAKAGGKPTLKAQVAGVYIEEQSSGVSSPIVGLLGVGNVAPSGEVGVAAIQLQQVLYAGGRVKASTRVSEHLAASESWQRDAVRADLILEVRQAFHDALLAEALVRVAEQSVETFGRHLEDVRRFEENGVVSHFEVLRAETELAARETDRTSAMTAFEIASMNLCRLTGIPQETPLELMGAVTWRDVETDVTPLVTRALDERSELKALDEGIAAAEAGVRVQQSEYRPAASAIVQYQQIDGGGRVIPEGLVAGVGGSWTWYAGGKRKGNVLEARAKVRSLEHQRTDVVRLVEMDVRQAHARLREAVAKIKREEKAVETATEGLRLAELRYEEGAGTQTETLDAELALTNARTARARALRDYAIAEASLARAIGRNSADAPAVE